MDINTIIYLENEIDQNPTGGSIIIINDTYSLYEDETVTVSVGMYSKTAVIENGTATIKGFTETGTVTVSVSDFTDTFDIDRYSKYEVGVGVDFSYIDWLSSIGESASGYSSLDDVLADEKMVRELFTRHASVDYLVNLIDYSAIEPIINNDYCAKWINLRDYALDTLYADSNIASLMDTADKYFYGEWTIIDDTTTPPTWGAKGNVPIMTSNTAPYGTASAYQVFDGSPSTTASSTDFSYQATNPICVRDFICKDSLNTDITGGTLQGSNDGSTWTSISTPSENISYYLYHRVHFGSSKTVATVQFYGRELKVSVPKMTSNTAPYGEASASTVVVSNNDAYKAFDEQIGSDHRWSPNNNSLNEYIQYKFTSRVCIKSLKFAPLVDGNTLSSGTFELLASNDNFVSDSHSLGTFTWTKSENGQTFNVNNDNAYLYYRVKLTSYTWTQSSNRGIAVAILQFYGLNYSEYDWDEDNPRHYIYDHGVELESIGAYVTPNTTNSIAEERFNSELYVYREAADAEGAFYTMSKIDVTSYNIVRAVMGMYGYDSTEYNCFAGLITSDNSPANNTYVSYSNLYEGQRGNEPNNGNGDISSVNASVYLGIVARSIDIYHRGMSITEWWLE